MADLLEAAERSNPQAVALVGLARSAVSGGCSDQFILNWLRAVPKRPARRVVTRAESRPGPRTNSSRNAKPPSSKALRRQEYARVQTLWRKNTKRAAHEILVGRSAVNHSLSEMEPYWKDLLSKESLPYVPQGGQQGALQDLWRPVTAEEVAVNNVTVSSASGRDGLSPRTWAALPPHHRALLYNILLLRGRYPPALTRSRTTFIPKVENPQSPSDYRPISVTSVVVRQLHKILASRITSTNLFDVRQRAFLPADGTVENTTVLDAVIAHARERLRELHVVTLDMAKAFDTVSHHALMAILRRRGIPEQLVSFLSAYYNCAETILEVGTASSTPIRVNRGVRQGDPLSPALFNIIIDDVLAVIPPEVGFQLGSSSVSALAFADDLVLIASSRLGMNVAIRAVEAQAAKVGLRINPAKCTSLSLVPAGKAKKIKVATDVVFRTADGPIPATATTGRWCYLGVEFDVSGIATVEKSLEGALNNITRAPLKPQQRLHLLRVFLIPQLYYPLVLGRITAGRLKELDVMVRSAVRKWLCLPKDTPLGFFHASVKDGGLGIPSLLTLIPSLLLCRLAKLEESKLPSAREASKTSRVQRRIRWAKKILATLGLRGQCTTIARQRYWSTKLHQSVDGYELREASRSSLSTSWMNRAQSIPGRDFIQHIRTRINALPTRIRVSRGQLRTMRDPHCRAGCPATETAAHVIQCCWRTHGGRVKRHDALVRSLSTQLQKKGWLVVIEPSIQTSDGLRKPDIIAGRGSQAVILDAQVVSGVTSLDSAHGRKKMKYASNKDLVAEVANRFSVQPEQVTTTTCTISWRGIWSRKSETELLNLELSHNQLTGLTTRVLQGSHTNWTRFNQMTGQRGVFGPAERSGVG